MSAIDELLELPPFSEHSQDDHHFLEAIRESIQFHKDRCPAYSKWLDQIGFSFRNLAATEDVPFFPSAVFKHLQLVSTAENQKVLRSSGTTSQLTSQISIDSVTSKRQTKVLAKILAYILGPSRRDFLILEREPTKGKSSSAMTARLAGMSGYLLAAKTRRYLLKGNEDSATVDEASFRSALRGLADTNRPPVLIGYTYMVYKQLIENPAFDIHLPEGTTLIHFGGWKRLEDKKIPKKRFNELIAGKLGLNENDIIDIYGFTEQLGSVYPSIGNSGMMVPNYSRVLVRDPSTMKILKSGEPGLIQFISPIPNSYPGLSLLNDDMAKLLVKERQSTFHTRFVVTGRPPRAESRGCGDTLPESFYL
ncbi:hypothetical protein OAL49_01775 [Gammaproteobacteria bacterium]|nr:hypothetical protein [Gammaproteobacteria bacterium]